MGNKRDPVYEEAAARQLEYSKRKFNEERDAKEKQAEQKIASESKKELILG